ncbi:hypothetical protein [Propionibacterium phage TCUCAP1]|nr:hypothetical protein [Propionibacterium phage TCUCAP1]
MFTVGWVLASPVLCGHGVAVAGCEGLPAVFDNVLQHTVWQAVRVDGGVLGDDVTNGLPVSGGGFECDAHDSTGWSSCMNWLKVLFPACCAWVMSWSVQSGCCCLR